MQTPELSNFAVFIISYKRAHNITTLKALQKANYTGAVYILIGEDDPQKEQYKQVYGSKIVVFDKTDYLDKVDLMDNNRTNLTTDMFARNAAYDIAEKLGLEYFLVLDDDYETFRWVIHPKSAKGGLTVRDFNKMLAALLKYYKSINIDVLAIAQSGDFIGGLYTKYKRIYKDPKRKAMNFFISSTKRRIEFLGRLNDDVNTYVYWGSRGKIFLTVYLVELLQKATQTNPGGMTEGYKKMGTYTKSFYSVMLCPSAVKIKFLNSREQRLHHQVIWNCAVPKIIRPVK